jgi:hypothetical protein
MPQKRPHADHYWNLEHLVGRIFHLQTTDAVVSQFSYAESTLRHPASMIPMARHKVDFPQTTWAISLVFAYGRVTLRTRLRPCKVSAKYVKTKLQEYPADWAS